MRGFNELIALCGGCCSCATCHVHIGPDWIAKLPPIMEDKDVLLDSTADGDGSLRLSCPIPLSDALDGLTVTTAAEG